MGNRYLAFTVSSVRYGIPVDLVLQIIRYENVMGVPTAPPFVEGVINLRGEVIPVINIRERFGLPKIEITRKNRLIVIRDEQRSYGLLVDGVRDIIELSDESIATEATSVFGMKAQFVLGIAKVKKNLLVILDIFKILSAPADISVMD